MTAVALHHQLHSSSSLNEPVQAMSSSGRDFKHSSASTFLGGATRSQTSLATSGGISNLPAHLDVLEGGPAPLSLEVRSHAYNPLATRDSARVSEDRARTSGETLQRADWEVKVRKKIKYIRAARIGFEVLFVGWAISTTTLYLISFYRSHSLLGTSFALGMAASSTFALGLLLVYSLLSQFSFTLLTSMQLTTEFIDNTRRFLGASATFFIGAPALINLALVIIWRDPNGAPFSTATATRELLFLARCRWDVDVIWSGPTQSYPCYRYGWGVWLAAALARVIVTLAIIVAYHTLVIAYAHTTHQPHLYPPRSRERYSTSGRSSLRMSWYRPGHTKAKNSIATSNPDDMSQMSMRPPDDIYTASPVKSPRKHRRDRSSATPSAATTLLEDNSPPQTPSAKSKGKQRESTSTVGTSSSVEKKKKAKYRGSPAAANLADNDPYPYPIRAPSPLDYDDTDDYGYPYAASLDPRPSTESQIPFYGRDTDQYSVDAYSQHLRSLSFFGQKPFSSNKSAPPTQAPPPPPVTSRIPPGSSASTNYKYPGVGPRKPDRSFEILNRVIKRMPTIESFGSRERDSRYRISTRAPTPTSMVEEEDYEEEEYEEHSPSGPRRIAHGRGRSVDFDLPEEESEAEVEATLDDDEDDDYTESNTPGSEEYQTPPSRVDLHNDDGQEGTWFAGVQQSGYFGRR